jgi:flavin-dependent dehydrogenase
MPAPKPILIAGGGLAGLALGIALRKQEIPVTIFEAGNYPRHRVCGEFISGRGPDVLEELGLKQNIFDAGAVRAETAAFFLETNRAPIRRLPMPALCLSRFTMDKLLAEQFQKLGGQLRTGERWQKDFGEGTVRATGRRPQPVENGWRWFGLKAHTKNVSLTADLEMHVGRHGYVGLCRLEGGKVNVCGLFRRAGAVEFPKSGFDFLRGNPGSALNERLAGAVFDENSFCSVAGLSFIKQRRATDKSECCVGDALAMIPPVTGNGMSLAFESAQKAATPLAAYSRGEMPWTGAREAVAKSCGEAFFRRLAWAKWLQTVLLSPFWQNFLFAIASRSDWFWRTAFEKTR